MLNDLSGEFFAWFDEQPRTPTGVLVPVGRGQMQIRSAPLAYAEWRARQPGGVSQPARLSRTLREVKAPTGVEPVYQVLQTCA